jgi:hypothetical protein
VLLEVIVDGELTDLGLYVVQVVGVLRDVDHTAT